MRSIRPKRHLVFLLPVAAFIAITSLDYVVVSWSIREGSREAGGLPFPFVPLLKSLIPLTAFLLLAQGAADALDAVVKLRGPRGPGRPEA